MSKCIFVTMGNFSLEFESRMKFVGEQIVLLLDNFSGQSWEPITNQMLITRCELLPPNTTSIFLPLDAGILKYMRVCLGSSDGARVRGSVDFWGVFMPSSVLVLFLRPRQLLMMQFLCLIPCLMPWFDSIHQQCWCELGL